LIGKATNYKKALDKIKETIVTNAEQMKTDDQIISGYLATNKIVATKTDWGTYVALTTPGEGNNLDKNSYAVVNYTGKTLKDSTFDSNTDPAFNHVSPFNVDMSEFSYIPGWIDGLKMMKKGSKGKIFIPSTLAYGKNGSSPKIGPNENLVFDIEILDVLTKDQYEANMKAEQEKQRAEMMEKRQKMMEAQQKKAPAADSVKKK
jgi:FKBP-type peptidyl-prolyl cis-trans isomerase